MTAHDPTPLDELSQSWQAELLRDDPGPDPARIAALEVQAQEQHGVSLLDVGLTAGVRRKWNPDLHPRGKDGRFIEVGGWIRAFLDLFDGDDGATKGRIGKVTKIIPDPKRPGHPKIHVDVRDDKGGTVSRIVDKDIVEDADDVKATLPSVNKPKARMDKPNAPDVDKPKDRDAPTPKADAPDTPKGKVIDDVERDDDLRGMLRQLSDDELRKSRYNARQRNDDVSVLRHEDELKRRYSQDGWEPTPHAVEELDGADLNPGDTFIDPLGKPRVVRETFPSTDHRGDPATTVVDTNGGRRTSNRPWTRIGTGADVPEVTDEQKRSEAYHRQTSLHSLARGGGSSDRKELEAARKELDDLLGPIPAEKQGEADKLWNKIQDANDRAHMYNKRSQFDDAAKAANEKRDLFDAIDALRTPGDGDGADADLASDIETGMDRVNPPGDGDADLASDIETGMDLVTKDPDAIRKAARDKINAEVAKRKKAAGMSDDYSVTQRESGAAGQWGRDKIAALNAKTDEELLAQPDAPGPARELKAGDKILLDDPFVPGESNEWEFKNWTDDGKAWVSNGLDGNDRRFQALTPDQLRAGRTKDDNAGIKVPGDGDDGGGAPDGPDGGTPPADGAAKKATPTPIGDKEYTGRLVNARDDKLHEKVRELSDKGLDDGIAANEKKLNDWKKKYPKRRPLAGPNAELNALKREKEWREKNGYSSDGPDATPSSDAGDSDVWSRLRDAARNSPGSMFDNMSFSAMEESGYADSGEIEEGEGLDSFDDKVMAKLADTDYDLGGMFGDLSDDEVIEALNSDDDRIGGALRDALMDEVRSRGTIDYSDDNVPPAAPSVPDDGPGSGTPSPLAAGDKFVSKPDPKYPNVKSAQYEIVDVDPEGQYITIKDSMGETDWELTPQRRAAFLDRYTKANGDPLDLPESNSDRSPYDLARERAERVRKAAERRVSIDGGLPAQRAQKRQDIADRHAARVAAIDQAESLGRIPPGNGDKRWTSGDPDMPGFQDDIETPSGGTARIKSVDDDGHSVLIEDSDGVISVHDTSALSKNDDGTFSLAPSAPPLSEQTHTPTEFDPDADDLVGQFVGGNPPSRNNGLLSDDYGRHAATYLNDDELDDVIEMRKQDVRDGKGMSPAADLKVLQAEKQRRADGGGSNPPGDSDNDSDVWSRLRSAARTSEVFDDASFNALEESDYDDLDAVEAGEGRNSFDDNVLTSLADEDLELTGIFSELSDDDVRDALNSDDERIRGKLRSALMDEAAAREDLGYDDGRTPPAYRLSDVTDSGPGDIEPDEPIEFGDNTTLNTGRVLEIENDGSVRIEANNGYEDRTLVLPGEDFSRGDDGILAYDGPKDRDGVDTGVGSNPGQLFEEGYDAPTLDNGGVSGVYLREKDGQVYPRDVIFDANDMDDPDRTHVRVTYPEDGSVGAVHKNFLLSDADRDLRDRDDAADMIEQMSDVTGVDLNEAETGDGSKSLAELVQDLRGGELDDSTKTKADAAEAIAQLFDEAGPEFDPDEAETPGGSRSVSQLIRDLDYEDSNLNSDEISFAGEVFDDELQLELGDFARDNPDRVDEMTDGELLAADDAIENGGGIFADPLMSDQLLRDSDQYQNVRTALDDEIDSRGLRGPDGTPGGGDGPDGPNPDEPEGTDPASWSNKELVSAPYNYDIDQATKTAMLAERDRRYDAARDPEGFEAPDVGPGDKVSMPPGYLGAGSEITLTSVEPRDDGSVVYRGKDREDRDVVFGLPHADRDLNRVDTLDVVEKNSEGGGDGPGGDGPGSGDFDSPETSDPIAGIVTQIEDGNQPPGDYTDDELVDALARIDAADRSKYSDEQNERINSAYADLDGEVADRGLDYEPPGGGDGGPGGDGPVGDGDGDGPELGKFDTRWTDADGNEQTRSFPTDDARQQFIDRQREQNGIDVEAVDNAPVGPATDSDDPLDRVTRINNTNLDDYSDDQLRLDMDALRSADWEGMTKNETDSIEQAIEDLDELAMERGIGFEISPQRNSAFDDFSDDNIAEMKDYGIRSDLAEAGFSQGDIDDEWRARGLGDDDSILGTKPFNPDVDEADGLNSPDGDIRRVAQEDAADTAYNMILSMDDGDGSGASEIGDRDLYRASQAIENGWVGEYIEEIDDERLEQLREEIGDELGSRGYSWDESTGFGPDAGAAASKMDLEAYLDPDREDFMTEIRQRDDEGAWDKPYPPDVPFEEGNGGWYDDGGYPNDKTLYDNDGNYLASIENRDNGVYAARDEDGDIGEYPSQPAAVNAAENRALWRTNPARWNDDTNELVDARGDQRGFVEQDEETGRWVAHGEEGEVLDIFDSRDEARRRVEGPGFWNVDGDDDDDGPDGPGGVPDAPDGAPDAGDGGVAAAIDTFSSDDVADAMSDVKGNPAGSNNATGLYRVAETLDKASSLDDLDDLPDQPGHEQSLRDFIDNIAPGGSNDADELADHISGHLPDEALDEIWISTLTPQGGKLGDGPQPFAVGRRPREIGPENPDHVDALLSTSDNRAWLDPKGASLPEIADGAYVDNDKVITSIAKDMNASPPEGIDGPVTKDTVRAALRRHQEFAQKRLDEEDMIWAEGYSEKVADVKGKRKPFAQLKKGDKTVIKRDDGSEAIFHVEGRKGDKVFGHTNYPDRPWMEEYYADGIFESDISEPNYNATSLADPEPSNAVTKSGKKLAQADLPANTVGNSLNGEPIQKGTKVRSVRDGLEGEVTGWPSQEKYPGTVYVKGPDGKKKARNISTLKTGDGTATAKGTDGPAINKTEPSVPSPTASKMTDADKVGPVRASTNSRVLTGEPEDLGEILDGQNHRYKWPDGHETSNSGIKVGVPYIGEDGEDENPWTGTYTVQHGGSSGKTMPDGSYAWNDHGGDEKTDPFITAWRVEAMDGQWPTGSSGRRTAEDVWSRRQAISDLMEAYYDSDPKSGRFKYRNSRIRTQSYPDGQLVIFGYDDGKPIGVVWPDGSSELRPSMPTDAVQPGGSYDPGPSPGGGGIAAAGMTAARQQARFGGHRRTKKPRNPNWDESKYVRDASGMFDEKPKARLDGASDGMYDELGRRKGSLADSIKGARGGAPVSYRDGTWYDAEGNPVGYAPTEDSEISQDPNDRESGWEYRGGTWYDGDGNVVGYSASEDDPVFTDRERMRIWVAERRRQQGN